MKKALLIISVATVIATLAVCHLLTRGGYGRTSISSSIAVEKMAARTVAEVILADQYAFTNFSKNSVTVDDRLVGVNILTVGEVADTMLFPLDKISIAVTHSDGSKIVYIIVPRQVFYASDSVWAWRFFSDGYADVVIYGDK